MKSHPIRTYWKVGEGAGLSTGRTGRVIEVNSRNLDRLFHDEPGLYEPFDRKREVLLEDDNGKVFSMFPQYLEVMAQ